MLAHWARHNGQVSTRGAMLVGLQAQEAGVRCGPGCERNGRHWAFESYACPQCESDQNREPGEVSIHNLLESERQDMDVLPSHYPGLPTLV